MKFINESDKVIYNAEVQASGMNEFEFIRKRQDRVKTLKDFRKSQTQKANWRHNRFGMMKGIKAFHKSIAGKKFHRKMGNFLATRDFSGLRYNETLELIPLISSMLTHTFLELDYWKNLDDQIEYSIFADEVFNECREVLNMIHAFGLTSKDNELCVLENYYDFFLRLCEANALIISFAKKFGKSEDEVERLWNDTQAKVKKQYDKTENDPGFFALLVGDLKKKTWG